METAAIVSEPKTAVRLENVLFATDFSQASASALPYAANIAKDFGGRLWVCHIVKPTALAIGAPEAAPFLYQAEMETAKQGLAEVMQAPELEGARPKAIMLSGIFGDQLRNAINGNDIDLVVAGTHGHTGMRRLLLGSAVEEICRVSPRPVLTVGPDIGACSNSGFKTILYPSDLSSESTQALPYANGFAERYGAKVIFLHVVPSELATNPDAVQLEKPLRERARQMVEEKLGTFEKEFMIEPGEAVETILRVARERHADLIAMGIRNAFVPGVQLRSSIAYRVITGAHCPVLTYRS